jgi:hypothetical protein
MADATQANHRAPCCIGSDRKALISAQAALLLAENHRDLPPLWFFSTVKNEKGKRKIGGILHNATVHQPKRAKTSEINGRRTMEI